MSTTTPTDLLGDPVVDEMLPEGQMLTSLEDLCGHTIRAVIESPSGNRPADLVIVTKTMCWIAISAVPHGHDHAALEVEHYYQSTASQPRRLKDYLSANDMYVTGLINATERAHLLKTEAAAKAQKLNDTARKAEEHAARLRAEADKAAKDAA